LSLFPGLFSDAISLYLADHFAQWLNHDRYGIIICMISITE
jgi:hypothetical protein